MSKPSISAIFDQLIEQTRRRGGCPSVRQISEASLDVSNLIAAYANLRALIMSLEKPGTAALMLTIDGSALVAAVEAVDLAVAALEPTN